MIDYFEKLTQEEQEELTELIQLFFRQTFLLERKYDKRTGRMQYTKEYHTCMNHLAFLRAYFKVAGITLCENAHMGVFYIQGETLWGEKLPRLATVYLLLLKLIYDEQMANASSSSHIVTTMGALNGKAGEFRVLRGIPSPTEMRRTIALLKKCQIIEPLDVLEELNEQTRMVIYPSIHAVLLGDDIRELLATFGNSGDDMTEHTMDFKQEEKRAGAAGEEENLGSFGEETAVSGDLEDLSE